MGSLVETGPSAQPAPVGVYKKHLRPSLHTLALSDRVTGAVRDRVCTGLTGDVLEIGYGSGLNQPHLPTSVKAVWAIEPSATALGLGEGRRSASAVPVVVAGDDAQSLPFPDERFDAALCTWVLCGVPDPGAALAEVARVLKPGATLHFVEHGLAPDPAVVRWQRRVNRVVAGCVLDNDVRSLLDASPLTVTEMNEHYEKGAPKAAAFMYEGRATARRQRPVTRRDATGAAVVHPAPAVRPGGRHLAPEVPGMARIAAPEDLTRSGRHTEPEWSRELHDPRRDEVDAFDWLGFAQY